MKHQQILEKKGLPNADDKMEMFKAANEILLREGYKRLGLDHFVLPGDEQYIAYNHQKLHRNFQDIVPDVPRVKFMHSEFRE